MRAVLFINDQTLHFRIILNLIPPLWDNPHQALLPLEQDNIHELRLVDAPVTEGMDDDIIKQPWLLSITTPLLKYIEIHEAFLKLLQLDCKLQDLGFSFLSRDT